MKNETNPKVTFLINALNSGGAEKVCITLGNELISRGYELELWVRQRKETTLSKVIDPKFKLTYLDRMRVRQCFSVLKDLIETKKPDIIIVFDIEFLILVHLIRTIYRLKFKIIARSINTLSVAYKDRKGILGKDIWYKLIRILLKRTDIIVAQSSGMKLDMVDFFNIPDSKIRIIHNPAINLKTKTNSGITEKAKNEFLFVGRLMAHKGLSDLIDAFAIALKEEASIRLTILGDGPYKSNVIDKVKQLNLEGSVSLEGFTPNPQIYYQRATATVLTSEYEGFPNVLVESIAEGTPIIAYDCPSGPADIIVPGVNGILVKYNDIQGITKAILDVVRGNIIFESSKIKESAKKFDLNKIVDQYEELIYNSF